jgi:GNAT superfamily N-acetyltransferase
MKCTSCEVNYGREEAEKIKTSKKPNCKKCDTELELIEFWTSEDIIQDLEFALDQQNPVVLVAEADIGIVGFTWGYKLPLEQFEFLKPVVNGQTNYMDEMAVRNDSRVKGIGTLLGLKYIQEISEQGLTEVALRTDVRNAASMTLFQKLGFKPMRLESQLPIYDPACVERIYLRRPV